ncbi:MAG: hypothetical protein Q4B14_04325 [Clostridia bacterium]|nr:hypothetical protein [Clostridia bacterium]
MGALYELYSFIDKAGRNKATLGLYKTMVIGNSKKRSVEAKDIGAVTFDIEPSSLNLNLNMPITFPTPKIDEETKDSKKSEGQLIQVDESTQEYVKGSVTGALSFTAYMDVTDVYYGLEDAYKSLNTTSIALESLNIDEIINKKFGDLSEKVANKAVFGQFITNEVRDKQIEEQEQKRLKELAKSMGIDDADIQISSETQKKGEDELKSRQERIKEAAESYKFSETIQAAQLMDRNSPLVKLQTAAQNDYIVQFVWGPRVFGPASIASLNVDFDFFSKSGAPLRAKIDITLAAGGGGQSAQTWLRDNESFVESYSGITSLFREKFGGGGSKK